MLFLFVKTAFFVPWEAQTANGVRKWLTELPTGLDKKLQVYVFILRSYST